MFCLVTFHLDTLLIITLLSSSRKFTKIKPNFKVDGAELIWPRACQSTECPFATSKYPRNWSGRWKRLPIKSKLHCVQDEVAVGVLAPGGRRACASWAKPAAMASASSTKGSLLLSFTWSSRQNNFVIKKLPWLALWLPWLQPSPPFPHLAQSYHCHKIFRRIEEWLMIIPKCCVDRKPASSFG